MSPDLPPPPEDDESSASTATGKYIREKASHARESAKESAASAKDRAVQAKDTAKDRAVQAKDAAKEGAAQAKERAVHAKDSAKESAAAAAEFVGEMPGPREQPGMAGPTLQKWFAWPFRAALAGLYKMGAQPWHVTLASLLLSLTAGLLILQGDRMVPGVLVILSGLADIFDGAIARLRGTDSRGGAFLDSVLDRISDLVVFGALYWSLSGQGKPTDAALALVALCVSVGVSLLRAEAESAGLTMTEGLFQRTERVVAVVLGLMIPGALLWMLLVLAVLGAVTLLQRFWSAASQLARQPESPPATAAAG